MKEPTSTVRQEVEKAVASSLMKLGAIGSWDSRSSEHVVKTVAADVYSTLLQRIEEMVPPEITRTSMDDDNENHRSMGWNACRAQMLRNLKGEQ